MKKVLVLASIAVLSMNASAESIGAVSGKVSTLGLGAEYTVPVNPQVEVGAAVNYLNYDRSYSSDDVDYDVNARLLSFGAIGYFYPWEDNGFNVNAGLFYNGNKVSLDAKPSAKFNNKEYSFNGQTYKVSDVNNPHGDVSFNKIAPYVGVGWKSGDRTQPGWAFNANVGVMFHGTPEVSLSAECSDTLKKASAIPGVGDVCKRLQNDIDAERSKVQDDVNKYKFYPVASIGFTYRF